MMRTIQRCGLPATAFVLSLFVSQLSAQQLPDPERFESAIRAFEAADQANRPPEGAIVLTGSSSIARWNDQAVAALAPLTVVPRGFGGSIMNDVLYYLDRVALKYNPRAILIYEGDNDTAGGLPKEVILDHLNQIIAKIHQTLPETRIYLLSVKPSVSRQSVWNDAQAVSAGYREIAEADFLVYYIDVGTPFLDNNREVMTDIFVGDNLHLNALGNEIWGSLIKAGLMPVEARYENR